MPDQNANYDESRVAPYELPPLFESGERDRVLRLFADHVYGETPRQWPVIRAKIVDETPVFGGLGTRQTIRFRLEDSDQGWEMVLYFPRQSRPAPAFLGLNFGGNDGIENGPEARRFPLQTILERGYGLATACYNEIEPDKPDGWREGVRPLLPVSNWGALGVWAWALSRCLDFLALHPAIHPQKIAVWGHSRLGKAALWAGAQDARFALVISNNSGCGGAKISRRNFGETLERITRVFPHWFAPQWAAFRGRENELPLDQHFLLALCAPRPLYVASAQDDAWADPRGEFLGCVAASPAWEKLEKRGLESHEMPPLNAPLGGDIRYHIRTGGHDVTLYDWEKWLDFADVQLR